MNSHHVKDFTTVTVHFSQEKQSCRRMYEPTQINISDVTVQVVTVRIWMTQKADKCFSNHGSTEVVLLSYSLCPSVHHSFIQSSIRPPGKSTHHPSNELVTLQKYQLISPDRKLRNEGEDEKNEKIMESSRLTCERRREVIFSYLKTLYLTFEGWVRIRFTYATWKFIP